MVSLSDPQCQYTVLKAMIIAPKVTGTISLISSSFIIQHVLRDRKRRSLVYHRLVMGMSISDFFGSIALFLTTWPIPRGEACLAAGTTGTCTAQGFFIQTAVLCTPTYNISLAIYYLLVIVKGWKETRVKKIEKYLHALPICLGFSTGFAALGLNILKSTGIMCWIGEGYIIYELAFIMPLLIAMLIFLPICMGVIYFHVLKQERKLDNYSASFAQKKRNQSNRVRNQAFLYVGCVYMTWIFGLICFIFYLAGKTPTYMYILHFTFLPLQGFFNLIVYMFPRILRYFERSILTQSFKRCSFFSSLKNRVSGVSKTQTTGTQSSSAYNEGIVESGVNGAALEDGDEVGHGDEEIREGLNGDNTNGEGESGEGGQEDGEEDVIDELEYIVDT